MFFNKTRHSYRNLIMFLICLIPLVGIGQPVQIKEPADGVVFSTLSSGVYFNWDTLSGQSHEIYIDDNDSFSSPDIYPVYSTDTVLQISDVYINSFWKIVTSGGQESIQHSFRLVDLGGIGVLSFHINAQEDISVLPNSLVSSWSNNGVSASVQPEQNNSNLRPEYITGFINDLGVVKFGGNDGLTTTYFNNSNFAISDNNFSIICAYQQISEQSVLGYILGFDDGNGVRGGVHSRGTAGSYNNFGLVYNSPLEEYRPASPGNFEWAVRSLGMNGIRVNSQDVTTTGSPVSNFKFNSIGSRMDQPSNLNFHGYLGDVLVYNDVLSDSLKELVESYLITKYSAYPDLGNDLDTCTNRIVLGPIDDPAYSSRVWSTGDTDVDSIVVEENGWYWVETEAFDRVVRDSIFIDGLVPKPVLDQVNDTTICLGDTIQISYTNTIGPGITVEWSNWTSGASIDVFENDTIYVAFTNTNGCSISSDTIIVRINEFPATEGLGSDRSICLNTNLFFEYGNASGGPYSHLWGDGSTTPSFEPTVVGTQDYTIEVTDSMGCVAFDTVQIELLNVEGPTAFFDVATACPYTPHNLVDASTPFTGDPIDSFSWFLPDDTLSGSNVSYQNEDTLSYPIILEVTSQAGCSNRYADTARFFPQPDVFFITNGECENNIIDFLANQLSTVPINQWEWNFDDPSSGVNNSAMGLSTNHLFATADNYNVSLIGTDQNGCSDTVFQNVEVFPSPSADFDFIESCEGSAVEFENTSTINTSSGNSITSYNWNFGDGSSSGQSDPNKLYFVAGSYSVTLTVFSDNGCPSQITQNVKVHDYPVVDRTFQSSCAGLPVSFQDNSFVTGGSLAIVEWSISNDTTLNGFDVSHTINQPGQYDVIQEVSSSFGCVSQDTFTFNLQDYLNADFDYSPSVMIGGAPFSLINTSTGNDSNQWDVEAIGSNSQNDYSFDIPDDLIGDTISVQLIIENSVGCQDTAGINLPVLPRETDLEVNELFLQEQNGFYTVGVRLTNKGTTPINEVELVYNSPNQSPIQETWEGLLLAGETTIYVFGASPSSAVPLEDSTQNFSCVRGTISAPTIFTETDLSNNEACTNIEPSSTVLVAPQPNPIGGTYTVRVIVTTPQTGSLMVYDAQGRKVDIIFENHQLEKGLNTFEVDASDYANGGYTLQYTGEQLIRVKMIKQ